MYRCCGDDALGDSYSSSPFFTASHRSNQFDIAFRELEHVDPKESLRDSFSLSRQDMAQFPEWTSFLLFFFVEESIQYNLSIHPVFNGRIAVPMLTFESFSNSKTSSMTFSASDPLALWDTYDLRSYFQWDYDLLRSRLKDCLSIWQFVMQLSIQRTSYSLNEVLGTLVLRRTIERCVSLYQFIVGTDSRLYDDDIGRYYHAISTSFREWDDTMRDQMVNPDTEDLWKNAVNAVGY
jgi:hypothetical protein